MTVYRSLKNLQKIGIVHKSNQSKTFFVCSSDVKDKHNPTMAICKKCKKTEEINLNSFSKIFQNLKTKKNTIFLILKWKYQLYVKVCLIMKNLKDLKKKTRLS